MTCRHPPGFHDAVNDRVRELTPPTPDAKNYEIEDVEQVGNHLVAKVKYPNCAKCAFEGVKVMVFFDTTIKDAIRWRVIDPHFRAARAASLPKMPSYAPAPAARFPGSPEGWKDALAWAAFRQETRTKGG